MSLADWANAGWLKQHVTSKEEITNLLAIADRDIDTAKIPGLASDWQLKIAYNAALQCARAALAAAGYIPERNAHHYRAIQSLAETISLDASSVNLLDSFRKKRNIADYEQAGRTSESEAAELVELAIMIKSRVTTWLTDNYPELVD